MRTQLVTIPTDTSFEELHTRARELVAAGRGRELLFMPGWWYA